MSLTVTILGCGSSGGVPRIGYGWGACDPSNPKNRRRRCSILVEQTMPDGSGKTVVLVDTSPDLREQLLDAEVSRVDAVLYTHEHADHTHGIDDLRSLAIHMRRRVPVYMDAVTSALLTARFSYCFVTPPGSDYPPIIDEHRISTRSAVTIEGPGGALTATPIPLLHGNIEALGFRFGRFAYAPDLNVVPDGSEALFRDLDVLVLDALRYTPHPSHLSVAEALALIERVQPRRAILTNLHTDIDYEALAAELPPGVEPAYDGMRIQVCAGGAAPGGPRS